MSLQGLSSAFSGLGGYLTSQSGSAVSVAANATRMCNGNGEISPVHENVLNLGGNSESVDWIEARRRESSENDGFYQGEDDDDDMHPAVRKAIGNSSNGPFSSISSRNSESSNKFSNSSNFKRRFLSKEECQKPIETPIWLLISRGLPWVKELVLLLCFEKPILNPIALSFSTFLVSFFV